MSAVGFIATTIRSPRSRDDVAAHASDMLVVVRHRDSDPSRLRDIARRGGPAVA